MLSIRRNCEKGIYTSEERYGGVYIYIHIRVREAKSRRLLPVGSVSKRRLSLSLSTTLSSCAMRDIKQVPHKFSTFSHGFYTYLEFMPRGIERRLSDSLF